MTSRTIVAPVALWALLAFTSVPLSGQADRAELRELQPKIDGAIARGVDHLLSTQLPDGSWPNQQVEYPNGQTALSIYTLLKAGLSREHPAVARGLRFLQRRNPKKTYSCALQMMAYEATKDPELKADIAKLLKILAEWQNSDGGFGYGGESPTRSDLSITQYAALGFRAAMLAGIKVPPRPLKSLMDFALDMQESQRRVNLPPDLEASDDGYERESQGRPGYAAGFKYTRGNEPTGSMTTAGIAILLICRDCYGDRISKPLLATINRNAEVGLNWMRKHWDVTKNPTADGKGAGWHLYYLYGLERVGSLLMKEQMAGHPWYLEGARLLVERQRGNGSWGGEADDCFAILFLKRATWAGRTTGADLGGEPVFAAATGDVHVRASGNPKMTVWVDGFGEKVQKTFGTKPEAKPMHILRVEYLVDSKVVVAVEGDPARPYGGETFAARHEFPTNGTFQVFARVHVLRAGATAHTADTPVDILESAPFNVQVGASLDPIASAMDAAVLGNQIPKITVSARASSIHQKNQGEDRAYDGLEGTAWTADKEDPSPTLTLRLGNGIQCRSLMISPGRAISGCGRLAQIEVHVNGEREARVAVVKGFDPVTIDLGEIKKVSGLKIRLVRAGKSDRPVGISEVYAY